MQYIHDKLIAVIWPESGPVGSGGCRDINLHESAVARPFQSAFGEDAYPTIVNKAVALFHSLNSNHPFHDGNKRTAIIALDDFLAANGYLHDLNNTEIYELAIRAASYKERGISHDGSIVEITSSLSDRMISLSEMKKEMSSDPQLQEIYRDFLKVRLRVRKHPLNRLV